MYYDTLNKTAKGRLQRNTIPQYLPRSTFCRPDGWGPELSTPTVCLKKKVCKCLYSFVDIPVGKRGLGWVIRYVSVMSL